MIDNGLGDIKPNKNLKERVRLLEKRIKKLEKIVQALTGQKVRT